MLVALFTPLSPGVISQNIPLAGGCPQLDPIADSSGIVIVMLLGA